MAVSDAWRRRWLAGATVVVAALVGGVVVTSASSPGAMSFVPVTPCRLLDTRPGADNVGGRATPLGAGETLTVPVRGANGKCTITASATAVSLNVTVVSPTAASYLTVFPGGAALPSASNLNWVAGQAPTPNAVTSPLSATGTLSIYNNSGTVHVVVDVVGYYESSAGGAIGPAGPPGPPGPTGATGSTGATGPRGFSAWDVIPSGVTVTGAFTRVEVGNGVYYEQISLPGLTPAPLTDGRVNYNGFVADDADLSCTGTASAPTAPPGKVCIYWGGLNANAKSGSAGMLPSQGFELSWEVYNGSGRIWAVWAYRVP